MKVLVVDDDGAIRNVVSQMLAVLGYEVLTATNGREAIDMFDSGREYIDLVVTDLRMPVVDGYEVIRRIWSISPNARIVCMSSHSPDANLEGATFLSKPFTLESLRDCVCRAALHSNSSPSAA